MFVKKQNIIVSKRIKMRLSYKDLLVTSYTLIIDL